MAIEYLNLNIGMLGNVDSGKSTTLGKLVTHENDNGNGKLRMLVSRHPHEIMSGRTSDISYHTSIYGNNRITFVDLAGHEKYLKTTIAGLNIVIPDLILLCIDKYAPTYKMTKEHMGLAIRMKIPFAICMTKIDLYDKQITETSIQGISRILKKTTSRGIKEVQNSNDVDEIISSYSSLDTVPIFRISNVTNEGVDLLTHFLSRIHKCTTTTFVHANKFITDRSYRIKGIGQVISGFNGGEPISVGDKLYLNGSSDVITIKSIHDNFKNEIRTLPSNVRGCLALRNHSEKIQNGSVISFKPISLVREIRATIEILSSHSTTITKGYQTVIHCGPIKRTASVSNQEELNFRGGMKGSVTFKFIKPTYVEIGQSIFFREGRVIGDGIISEIIS